jgi:hypothetical protein
MVREKDPSVAFVFQFVTGTAAVLVAGVSLASTLSDRGWTSLVLWGFLWLPVHALNVVDAATYLVMTAGPAASGEPGGGPSPSDRLVFRISQHFVAALSGAALAAFLIPAFRASLPYAIMSAAVALACQATRPMRGFLRHKAGYPSSAREAGWQRRILEWVFPGSPMVGRILGESDRDVRGWWLVVITTCFVLTFGTLVAIAHEIGESAGSSRQHSTALDVVAPPQSGDTHHDRQVEVPRARHDQVDVLFCEDDPEAFLTRLDQLGVAARESLVALEAWNEVGAVSAGCPSGLLRDSSRLLIQLSGAVSGPTGVFVAPGGASAAVVYTDELPTIVRRLGTILRVEKRVSADVATNQWFWQTGLECSVIARPVLAEPSAVPPSPVALAGLSQSLDQGGVPESFALLGTADLAGQQTWEVRVRKAARNPGATWTDTIFFDSVAQVAVTSNGRTFTKGCPTREDHDALAEAAQTLSTDSRSLITVPASNPVDGVEVPD